MNIEKEVISIIKEMDFMSEKEMGLQTKLVDDLGFDSLDYVEFTIAIEDRFKIDTDENLIYEMKTIQEVVSYIEKNLKSEGKNMENENQNVAQAKIGDDVIKETKSVVEEYVIENKTNGYRAIIIFRDKEFQHCKYQVSSDYKYTADDWKFITLVRQKIASLIWSKKEEVK